MILFFKSKAGSVVAVKSATKLKADDIKALSWLLGNAKLLNSESVEGRFTGPRREMITPWSTTAVEITQNMNIKGVERMEEYFPTEYKKEGGKSVAVYDKMLQRLYEGLDQQIFTVNKKPDEIVYIKDFEK